ncbi:MAG: hypothetical protein ACRCXD_10865 [Luteolibacter sp.]
MKIIPLLVAAAFALSVAYADQPKLNEAQVVEMAKIIAKKSKNEHDFVFDEPKYAEKTGVWSLSPRMATSAGIHFLEIRDKDLYFRVGFSGNTGYTPKGSEKFRLPPDLRGQFKRIAGEEAK